MDKVLSGEKTQSYVFWTTFETSGMHRFSFVPTISASVKNSVPPPKSLLIDRSPVACQRLAILTDKYFS